VLLSRKKLEPLPCRTAACFMLSKYLGRENGTTAWLQGMNFIAACFMLFMGEEDAFWCLAAIVEDLLPGYFDTRMVAPQVGLLCYNARVIRAQEPSKGVQPCYFGTCMVGIAVN
jgi:hypothetical protein